MLNRTYSWYMYLHFVHSFPTVDFPIWKETEGAIDHVLNYIEKHDLQLPSEDEMLSASSSSVNSGSSGQVGSASHSESDDKAERDAERKEEGDAEDDGADNIESDIEMFESMYRTAIEMASS
jgi:hypothetical protein